MESVRPRLQVWAVNRRALVSGYEMPDLGLGKEVRVLSENELRHFADDPGLDLPRRYVDLSIARRNFCVGVLERGQLIAYVWRGFGPAVIVADAHLLLDDVSRFGAKAFTRPEFRGQHLQTPASMLSDQICIDGGYKYAISMIETHNFASLASDRRRGNEIVGYLVTLQFRDRTFVWRTPGIRRLGYHVIRLAPGEVGPIRGLVGQE